MKRLLIALLIILAAILFVLALHHQPEHISAFDQHCLDLVQQLGHSLTKSECEALL